LAASACTVSHRRAGPDARVGHIDDCHRQATAASKSAIREQPVRCHRYRGCCSLNCRTFGIGHSAGIHRGISHYTGVRGRSSERSRQGQAPPPHNFSPPRLRGKHGHRLLRGKISRFSIRKWSRKNAAPAHSRVVSSARAAPDRAARAAIRAESQIRSRVHQQRRVARHFGKLDVFEWTGVPWAMASSGGNPNPS